MAIRSKNLNLLPVLQALLKYESVARAAKEVGLSQPAMSSCLARLREQLGDPLLVRVGRSMCLTPRAIQLRGELDDVCIKIEQLFHRDAFDPARANRRFRIGVPDYLAYLLSDRLFTTLQADAPGIRFHFVDVPDNIETLMSDLKVDLLISADFGMWPSLRKEFLFQERYVAAVGPGHPLLELSEVHSEDLRKYPGATVNYDLSFSKKMELRHSISGIPIVDYSSQISTMSQFIGILMASRVPNVARAPHSLVSRLQQLIPLETIHLKGEPTEFETCMFWAPATEEEPEQIWLRDLIRTELKAIVPHSFTG